MTMRYAQGMHIADRTSSPLYMVLRWMLAVVPLVHLVLSPVHVGALLRLENETSGFVMFLTMLGGLVVVFQAFRMRSDRPWSLLACALFSLVVALLAGVLLGLYLDALLHQQPLDSPFLVHRAVVLSASVALVHGVASVFLALMIIPARQRSFLRHKGA